jgi:hypothetical protein
VITLDIPLPSPDPDAVLGPWIEGVAILDAEGVIPLVDVPYDAVDPVLFRAVSVGL